MKHILYWITLTSFVSSGISESGKCQNNIAYCKHLYGHSFVKSDTLLDQNKFLEDLSHIQKKHATSEILAFFCLITHPPCGESVKRLENTKQLLKLSDHKRESYLRPCQETCKRTWKLWKKSGDHMKNNSTQWPLHVRCENFFDRKCIQITDSGKLKFVTNKKHRQRNKPPNVPVIPEDESVVEVVTFNQIQTDQLTYKADPNYFHGWADVQGKGRQNDYCRVMGRGHRQFLACALDGKISNEHHYVSTLGFEPGVVGSWYMRDEDQDGRDDYCRCIERKDISNVFCMKAGERGFYGGPLVGGSQYTFKLPGSEGCLTQ